MGTGSDTIYARNDGELLNYYYLKSFLLILVHTQDECTHLKNFSVPYDTSLIIAVCAKDDAYVPREGCSRLEDIWPGAEVSYFENHL